jgi:hypothetical protein
MWGVYRAAFEPVNSLAAQRHLMTHREFEDLLVDDRIGKYLAIREGRTAGLAVMTDNLEAWPLISAEFYARKYPGRRVFYVGFVAVPLHQTGVFTTLIGRMQDEIAQADGVAAMDFSGFNLQQRGIGDVVRTLLTHRVPTTTGGVVDRQEFWSFDFRETDDVPGEGQH